MKPSHFIAFKAVWCIFVGLTSVFVGFMSATCDQSFAILRQRFSERESAGSQGSSWRASRNGRSLQQTQFGEVTVGTPNIRSGDL
jgi:hypothetical protein